MPEVRFTITTSSHAEEKTNEKTVMIIAKNHHDYCSKICVIFLQEHIRLKADTFSALSL